MATNRLTKTLNRLVAAAERYLRQTLETQHDSSSETTEVLVRLRGDSST